MLFYFKIDKIENMDSKCLSLDFSLFGFTLVCYQLYKYNVVLYIIPKLSFILYIIVKYVTST